MSAKVAKKILEVMKCVDYLQKDGKVEYGRTKYSYLSEEKITTEIRKALCEVGLILYPTKMEIIGERETTTKSGTAAILNILSTYRVQDAESGEYIEVQALGEGMDSGDKTVYKAMTGAFKYAQRQTFMIPTGDDPDQISSDELKNGKGVTMPQKKKWPNEPIGRVQTNGNGASQQTWGKSNPQPREEEMATGNQRKAIYAKANNLQFTNEDMKEIIQTWYRKDSSKKLTKAEASDLLGKLSEMEKQK